jgi:hypothetical protein
MADSRSIQEKYVTLFDTAKRCLLIVDQLYADLTKQLDALAEFDAGKQDQATVVRLFVSAHGLIDFIHRYSEVIQAMPLLSKKRAEVKSLLHICKPVSECRNYVQHIRNHLMSDETIDYPILGSISWIKGERDYVLFPNQATAGHKTPGIAYDTWQKKYVCKYQLSISSYQLKLDLIYNEVKQFWKWLSFISHIEPAIIKEYDWGGAAIVYSQFTKE